MTYHWHRDGGRLYLSCDGHGIGFLAPPEGALASRDEVETLAAGVFRVRRTFRLPRPIAVYGLRLTVDFVAARRARYAMIPAVSYNGLRRLPDWTVLAWEQH